MTLLNRIRIALAVMLAVSLGGVAVAFWSVRNTQFQIERMDLAHRVHSHTITLKSQTYQLFKQYADAILIGDQDRGTGEAELMAEIRASISMIRRDIAREVELVGEEEIEELHALAEVERAIQRILTLLDDFAREGAPETYSERWRELTRVLDGEIDKDFKSMMTALLEGEVEELVETREEVSRDLVLYTAAAAVFTLIALVAITVIAMMLSRRLGRPVSALVAGAERFSEGDLNHRVREDGTDEIAQMGRAFNQMAERLYRQRLDLSTQNEQLELAILHRTEQLERLLEEAKAAAQARRRMLADVSHELRTPLTIIHGEADVALRRKDAAPEEYREALRRTRESAAHTALIVDDLLFVARAEMGEQRLKTADLDLRRLVAETIDTFRPGLTLASAVETAPMRGDATRLRQLLLVLLQNAAQYGGGYIGVTLAPAPGGYRLAVEDDGPGLSETDKVAAFERFFRGSNAADRYAEGVGLGLPIAKSVAEAHGGRITLADREPHGLTAVVLLPARPKLAAVS